MNAPRIPYRPGQLLCRHLCIAFCLAMTLTGCNSSTAPDATATSSAEPESSSTKGDNDSSAEPVVEDVLDGAVLIDGQALVAAALPADLLEEGWVRLFDQQSFYGWFIAGNANWRVEDGILKVDDGERSYLCTNFQIADFELQLEFRGDADTNSGIFLRTRARPENVANDCLELNIAPPDNPFPTGSFVQREKLEPEELGEFDPTEWHQYHVRLHGGEVEVKLDGKTIMQLSDVKTQPSGYISLQHNSGRIEFRNVLFRPIQGEALSLAEDWEGDWEKSVKEDAKLNVTPEADGLRLTGGLGQLQSKEDFDNFVLQASYSLASPEVNAGIFFRCVRDAMLDGYECQVNHAILDDDPLQPADAGAGAIFRRADARVVIGDGKRSHITLLASGPSFATWVNGVQVAEFTDTREPDENPRRGLRLEAGPISLQAHDPKTDVIFHKLRVTNLPQ